MYQAAAVVPGSCGELVQGQINGRDFLVTCPINRYSRVKVLIDKGKPYVTANKSVPKTIKAVELLLNYLDLSDHSVKLHIENSLLPGKGMASSTADITAALAAVFVALRQEIDYNILSQIALEVEPTDGTFLPGISFFDHRQGQTWRFLGNPLELSILIFTEPGTVDTVSFNNNPYLQIQKTKKESRVEQALYLLEKSLKEKDPRLMGRASIISARAHQELVCRPYLEKLIYIIDDYPGAYGINIAHSGAVVGVLLDQKVSPLNLIYEINNQIKELFYLEIVDLISGGVRMDGL